MTGHFWLKLYCEILDDLKIEHMTDHQRWRFIQILLYAKEINLGGKLGDLKDLCWRLRITLDECTELLAYFESVNITTNTPDGWILTNFAKRQERSESAERVARWREKKRNEVTPVTEDVTCNVTVAALPSTSTSTSLIKEDLNDQCLSPLSTAFVNATGIPELTGGPKKWFDALSDLGKAGVEPIDIETAVNELKNKGYNIVNLRSIVNPAISAMGKRVKPGNNGSGKSLTEGYKYAGS